LFAAVIGVFVCSISLSGQQTASPPALLYLQRSLSQLEGNASISDVTLTGSVRRIAGSATNPAPPRSKALSSGVARADLSLSSGTVSETYDSCPAGPAGTWSGPDGHSHSIPQSSRPRLPGSFLRSRYRGDSRAVTIAGLPSSRQCDARLPTHLAHPFQDEPAIVIHVIGPSLQGQWQNCGELGRLLPVGSPG
jgi:hypothetical protein